MNFLGSERARLQRTDLALNFNLSELAVAKRDELSLLDADAAEFDFVCLCLVSNLQTP